MLAIYARRKGEKRFRIIGDGSLQSNTIHGEFFPDEVKESLEKLVKEMSDVYPEYDFEIRSYDGEGSLFPEEGE